MFKRLFDIVFSFTGLLLLLPIFAVVAVAVRCNGKPVFYRQERVGLNGKRFWIFKFRSMVVNAEKTGQKVTAEHDDRITPIGKFLRKTKLDELPQLLNVLTGDMSLVGPRPEVPFYVELWPEKDRNIILSIKPGITDYATLYYHDEQSVLANADNPEKAYITKVMPHKLKLYRNYLIERSFRLDFYLILATLAKMIGIKI